MLNRRNVLRATLAGAMAGTALLSTTDCAARSSTSSTPATTTAAMVTDGARLATGSAAIGCGGFGNGGLIFGVHSDGTLWGYPSARVPDACEATWLPENQLGAGWEGMRRIFADHRGVDNRYSVFAINEAGDLLWYGYDPQDQSWLPGSGKPIGGGWGQFDFVTYAGNGVFYAVDSTGGLRWYRNLDPFGGSAEWATGSGTTIATGWGSYPLLFSSGGSIYAITTAGDLTWFGYSDPTRPNGSFVSDSGRVVGTGWDIMVTVDAVAGTPQPGVLVHGVDHDGHLREYLNIDPNGVSSWAAGSSTIVGTHNWLS